MKKTLIILTAILFGITFCIGQDDFQTDSETHIFWQPEKGLKRSDFKGDATKIPNAEKYCDTIGLCTVASIGVFAVLDIPKKKKLRGKLKEKPYIAPAFEYSTSYIVKNDSLGLEKQKVVFDICELSARWMRKELAEMVNKMDAYGTISIWFKTIESDAQKMRTEMIDGFTQEVFIFKKEGAYLDWREKVDELLKESEKFATKPEECYRFVSKKPLDQNYIMAKKVIGKLFE
ncbi:MAG: hypothetical protein AAF348_10580 [Bacteroidota bacterium]